MAERSPSASGTITALFHKHCRDAGLPRIRLHDVRHSYATAALKAGVSPKIVSERLGHATAASLILRGSEADQEALDALRDARTTPKRLRRTDLGKSPGQRW